MSRRSRRLGIVVGAFVVLCAIVWNLLSVRSTGAAWQSSGSGWDATSSLESPVSSASSATYAGEDAVPAGVDETTSLPTYAPSPVQPGIESRGCSSSSVPASPQPPGGTCAESYAVAADALRGLPPDAAPGTRFTLWVSWGPRVSKAPRIQKLIPVVTLQRLIPPVVDGGAVTALLSIPRSALSDMLYGDRFGDLAVTVRP